MTKGKKEEKKENKQDKKHEKEQHNKKEEEKKDLKKSEEKKEEKEVKKDQTKEGEEKKEEKKEKIIVPNFVSRVKIVNQITVGKVTLNEYNNFNEIVGEGPTIIEAFPNGNSITNIITTSHIISHLKLQLVGEIVSQEFPPLTVVQLGIPSSGARLYANKHLVVISSEYSVKEASIQHDLVQLILKFAEVHKAAAVLTIDALSGDPSEATSLLDQIQLSADQTGEEGAFGEEDNGDYEDYGDAYAYSIKSSDSPVDSSDPIIQLGKNTKKNNIKLTKDIEEEKETKKASGKTITKTIPIPVAGEDKEKEKKEEEEKINIWFLTNEQKFGDFFKSLEYEPVVEVSLSGVQAGLVNQCRYVDTPVILLLARLDKLELGARPALLLIQTIDKFLKLIFAGCADIDISKLEESTNSLEAKLNELLKKLQPPKEETPNMLYM